MISPTLYFYPRSPCGERRQTSLLLQGSAKISIHALLAESDNSACCGVRRKYISIHALLAESDKTPADCFSKSTLFLSTLSLRRATRSDGPWQGECKDFYPRSPCGERHIQLDCRQQGKKYFYPRSPCGERRAGCGHVAGGQQISIHALLAESDLCKINTIRTVKMISIHALLAESDVAPLLAVGGTR